MKSEKLQDAIGMVDSNLVECAYIKEKNKKSKIIKSKWIAPVAAVLAICIAIGVFLPDCLRFMKPHENDITPTLNVQSTEPDTEKLPVSMIKAEYRAEYPTMVKHGELSQQAWAEDRYKQLSYCGAGKNLDQFFQSTVNQFLTGDSGKNKLYSPLNVYMALSMVAEVTDSNSRQQILDLLNAGSIGDLRTQAHAIWNANYCDDGLTNSVIASSLWLSDDVEYNEQTINTLSKNYYASIFSGKMGSDEYSKLYRDWLNEQTDGLLKDQIDSKELDPDTIMAIATTLYYKAQWNTFFAESNTKESEFYSVNGTQKCDFMNQTFSDGMYYWGDKFSAVSKSINGNGQMYFILPDERMSTEDLLKDKEALSFITSCSDWGKSKKAEIKFSVPKFDVNSELDLIDGLKNLGVTDCFSSTTADFSPILPQDEAYVSEITHGVRVSIDEEGITGAAYTEVMCALGAVLPDDKISFVVNRPFVFVITGADKLPLFVGVVNHM